MTESARLSRKNQVVIPKEVRKELGIGAGDEVLFEVRDGRALLRPKPKSYSKYMLGLHKDVWKGLRAEEYVEGERGKWQRRRKTSRTS